MTTEPAVEPAAALAERLLDGAITTMEMFSVQLGVGLGLCRVLAGTSAPSGVRSRETRRSMSTAER